MEWDVIHNPLGQVLAWVVLTTLALVLIFAAVTTDEKTDGLVAPWLTSGSGVKLSIAFLVAAAAMSAAVFAMARDDQGGAGGDQRQA